MTSIIQHDYARLARAETAATTDQEKQFLRDEETRTETPSKDTRRLDKMIVLRRTILTVTVCLLVILGLTTAAGPRRWTRMPCHLQEASLLPPPPPTVEAEPSAFTALLDAASPDSIRDLLRKYLPEKYKHGVFPTEHSALEAVHQDDPALATVIAAQAAKRADGSNATTTAAPAPTTSTDGTGGDTVSSTGGGVVTPPGLLPTRVLHTVPTTIVQSTPTTVVVVVVSSNSNGGAPTTITSQATAVVPVPISTNVVIDVSPETTSTLPLAVSISTNAPSSNIPAGSSSLNAASSAGNTVVGNSGSGTSTSGASNGAAAPLSTMSITLAAGQTATLAGGRVTVIPTFTNAAASSSFFSSLASEESVRATAVQTLPNGFISSAMHTYRPVYSTYYSTLPGGQVATLTSTSYVLADPTGTAGGTDATAVAASTTGAAGTLQSNAAVPRGMGSAEGLVAAVVGVVGGAMMI